MREKKRWSALLLALILTVMCALPAGAVSSYFLSVYSDWHFDLRNEPDRAMTQEEFIALTTAYSYWTPLSTPVGSLPDSKGHEPSAWAAPFIAAEAKKGTIKPAELDYRAPATLGFAMKFICYSKGLYGFNAVNIRQFSGTKALTAEEILCMNTAVDYGILPYTKNMDASVTLPRRDLETKYKIPQGVLQPKYDVMPQTTESHHSVVFFEDCYNMVDRLRAQIQTVMDNADNFNMVSLDYIYMTAEKVAEDERSDFRYVGDMVFSSKLENEPKMDLVRFCHDHDIQVLGGVLNYYNDSILKLLTSDEAIDTAVRELMQVVSDYDLDGLNVDIEVSGSTYRDTYSRLVTALSEALHRQGKLLVLTVNGRMWEKDGVNSVYDYAAVDKAADLVAVITYDIHSAGSFNRGSEYGELSNLTFTGRCARYCAAYFGADRVIMGVAGYAIAFDTTTHKAENITYADAMERMNRHKAVLQRDDISVDGAWFEYYENGHNYRVYIESPEGIQRRLSMVTDYGLGGIFAFYAGGGCTPLFDGMGAQLGRSRFHDVADNHFYTEPVCWAVERGITSGTSTFRFSPENPCTRGQVVTFLWRAMGCPEPESTEHPFTDVKPTAYYCKAVLWAVENGITNGVGATTFKPDAPCTRGQVVTFLHRAHGTPEGHGKEFTDVAANAYYYHAVQWAVQQGITNGISATTFGPDQTCTRGQIVTFLWRDLAK